MPNRDITEAVDMMGEILDQVKDIDFSELPSIILATNIADYMVDMGIPKSEAIVLSFMMDVSLPATMFQTNKDDFYRLETMLKGVVQKIFRGLEGVYGTDSAKEIMKTVMKQISVKIG